MDLFFNNYKYLRQSDSEGFCILSLTYEEKVHFDIKIHSPLDLAVCSAEESMALGISRHYCQFEGKVCGVPFGFQEKVIIINRRK